MGIYCGRGQVPALLCPVYGTKIIDEVYAELLVHLIKSDVGIELGHDMGHVYNPVRSFDSTLKLILAALSKPVL